MSEVAHLEIDKVQLADLINRLDEAVRPARIKAAMESGADNLVNWIAKNRLSGPRPQYLGVKTGALRASIAHSSAETTGNGFEVRIGTNKIYAAIHEFGGVIRAKNSPYLRFQVDYGTRVFSMRGGFLKRPQTMSRWVSVKQVTIPARPFLTPAITEPQPRALFIDGMRESLANALEKK